VRGSESSWNPGVVCGTRYLSSWNPGVVCCTRDLCETSPSYPHIAALSIHTFATSVHLLLEIPEKLLLVWLWVVFLYPHGFLILMKNNSLWAKSWLIGNARWPRDLENIVSGGGLRIWFIMKSHCPACEVIHCDAAESKCFSVVSSVRMLGTDFYGMPVWFPCLQLSHVDLMPWLWWCFCNSSLLLACQCACLLASLYCF
jgi:hypothetical protein